MAGPHDARLPLARPQPDGLEWPRFRQAATAALQRRLAQTPELSPRDVAETVAAALPGQVGGWLRAALDELGWLRAEARIPFDILDGPACPRVFRGRGRREVARLAVFGPAGQGLAARDKHRQGTYQQLCAQIMREAVDTDSLQHVAARALSHPDLAGDATLAAMVRSFIAEREAALRAARRTPAEDHARQEQASKLQHAFAGAHGAEYPTRGALLGAFAQLHRDFDAYIAQFEEQRAQRTLCKMRDLRQGYPVHIPPGDLQQCEERFDRLLRRIGTYRRQLEELAGRGAAAAQAGDQKTAAWILRRLEAVHTLLPHLLPTEQLEGLRALITRSGSEHESRESALELINRERAVGNRIRNLAGVIHRFHEVARQAPRDAEAYCRAEANYRRAVEEIRALDTDWLAGLIVQLETMLADLDDPAPLQTQLDQFIVNVRTALNRLRVEIRGIQTGGPPLPGSAPPSPPADKPAPPR
jgi:hypothetical protein